MSGAGREPVWVRGAFATIFGVAAIVIYLPIVVMFVFSFNSGRYQVMPFRDFTVRWYERLLVDPQYISGLVNSVLIAGAVSVTATAIAFACAYSLVNARFPGKTAATLFVLAPLAVPLVLIGISLRLYFVSLGLEPSLWLVFVGQTLFVLPLAILNLRNRIAQIPRSHEEAAWALGASRLRAIVEIVLPSCRFAVVATLIVTFTFAFDEFVIAYFLTNFDITLPIKIWTTLVTGFDPTINAVGVCVFLFSLGMGIADAGPGCRGRGGTSPRGDRLFVEYADVHRTRGDPGPGNGQHDAVAAPGREPAARADARPHAAKVGPAQSRRVDRGGRQGCNPFGTACLLQRR